MRLTYFLPNNLDLENLINENRPKFKPFNLQKAKYLLHLISAVRHNKKSLLTEDFVKLSSKSMQHKVHNYYKFTPYAPRAENLTRCRRILGFFAATFSKNLKCMCISQF